MKYFTIKELTRSTTAEKYKRENLASYEVVENLTKLVDKVLDPLREVWGSPIRLTCAYRDKKVNAKVRGHPNSHHTYGCAADIVV